ncbi:hypothetical protein Bca52824_044304 [Brassica carinata]|uniref:Uncharacterized protein n=1 Tax=Brassica carinata TaxID=52824 RepID=A0A8X7S0C3_BRACI|nr:hypothetical protein Bca52824_044304 [Brassica carinata]
MCSSFTFSRPTTTTDDLENLYKVYGIDRSVVLDLAAYLSFFHSCGLIFPIPEPILEVLAELGLSLTQLLLNFLRHLVVFLVKAREEGLAFGLSEFRQFVLVKRNNQNPGTFLVSPRPGRHVIEEIPYRDEKWREQFFVFKMDRASMGDFDFSQLPRRWAENTVPSGSSLMLDEIRGMMRVLRRGRSNWFTFDRTQIQTVFALPAGIDRAPLVEESGDEAEHSQEVVVTPSVQNKSSDRLTRQLVRRSSFQTSGSTSRTRASGKSPLISIHDSNDKDVSGETRPPVSLSPGSEDETAAATRKRRRSSEGVLPGLSRPRFVSEGDDSSSACCHLPSLASLVEREAYAKVVVGSSKVMEAFNEYVVTMEDHVVASRNDKEIESIGFEIKRLSEELETTKREGKKDAEKIEALTDDWRRVHLENEALTSQMVAQRARIAVLEYREVLESLKGRWASKKKEVSAEICLQEVAANIDLLNEHKDGGLTVDAELARLKEIEGDCEGLVALAAVPDWSISELDLPQVRHSTSFSFVFTRQRNITSRRSNSRDSDRVQTQTSSANVDRVKDPEGEKYVAHVKSSIPTSLEGHDRPPKKAKTNGSDRRPGVSGEVAVAKPFHWQFSHSKDCPITEDPDSVAHLVRVLLDVLKACEVACSGVPLASSDGFDSFRGGKFHAVVICRRDNLHAV